jgi:hypothetical protein
MFHSSSPNSLYNFNALLFYFLFSFLHLISSIFQRFPSIYVFHSSSPDSLYKSNALLLFPFFIPSSPLLSFLTLFFLSPLNSFLFSPPDPFQRYFLFPFLTPSPHISLSHLTLFVYSLCLFLPLFSPLSFLRATNSFTVFPFQIFSSFSPPSHCKRFSSFPISHHFLSSPPLSFLVDLLLLYVLSSFLHLPSHSLTPSFSRSLSYPFSYSLLISLPFLIFNALLLFPFLITFSPLPLSSSLTCSLIFMLSFCSLFNFFLCSLTLYSVPSQIFRFSTLSSCPFSYSFLSPALICPIRNKGA